jgi:hypothetical protein
MVTMELKVFCGKKLQEKWNKNFLRRWKFVLFVHFLRAEYYVLYMVGKLTKLALIWYITPCMYPTFKIHKK